MYELQFINKIQPRILSLFPTKGFLWCGKNLIEND